VRETVTAVSRPAARHTLGFAVAAMAGRSRSPISPRTTFAGAAADSRRVRPGQIFFALPGERVDGERFCGAAIAAGAAAVVVGPGRGRPPGCERAAVIEVADPRRALGDLAQAVRGRFSGIVVGVTGSNGKTTTKELVAAALGSAGPVLRTEGNLNTDVGLPLTVLGAAGRESFWVLEMAMRGRGEIARLAEIASPHIGIVTNVAAAHLGRLGSLDEVARAKGELYHGLAPDGVAVLPAGDNRLEAQAAHIPEARKLRFGDGEGDVSVLDAVAAGPSGQVVRYAVRHQPIVVRLPMGGAHNARNGAAALCAVLGARVPLLPAAAALTNAALPPHRSAAVVMAGRVVLDDCYNANPASMAAALTAVAASVGSTSRAHAFAVLGDMLELGPEAETLHDAVGADVARQGIAGLVCLGALGERIARGALAAGLPADRVRATADPGEAARQVAAWTRPGDWILVKASRGMQLERVVSALQTELATARD